MADSEIIYITVSDPPSLGVLTAANVPSTPTGGLSASNVQAALAELDTEKLPASSFTAAQLPCTPTGNISSSNVQAALSELDTEKLNVSGFLYVNLPDVPANLSALAALIGAADRIAYFTGSGTMAVATLTAAGRALIDDADAATQRQTLGLSGTNVLAPSIMAASATSRVFGRKTAGAGAGEELTVSELLDFIGSATRGDILFRGVSGWQRLAAGTLGYFLKSQGPGADLMWDVGGSGAAVDGSNITTPTTWRSKLDTPSNIDINSRINGLLGGVVFDNVTNNQRAYASLLDYSIGTSDFSVTARVDVPATNPSNAAPIWCLSQVNNSASVFSLSFRIDTAGSLQLTLSGTAQNSYRRYYYNGFLAAYAGQSIYLTVTRSSGVIAVYASTTDITASFSETTNAGSGVMPASWAESISSQFLLIGGIGASAPGYAGKIARVVLWDYALSSTEVATNRTVGPGAAEQWVYTPGTNCILSGERNATFAKAANDWAATGGGTSISAGGAVVLGAAAGSVSLSGIGNYLAQLIPGATYQLSFDVSSGSFGGNSVTAYFGVAVNDTAINLGTFSANGSYTFEFTATFGLGVVSLIANTGGSSFTLANVKLTRVALVNGSFETAGSPLGTWSTSVTPSSTVTRDTTNQRSGSACAALNVVAGALALIQQSGLTVGRRYRVSYWAKISGAGPQLVVCDSGGSNYATPSPTTSWVLYQTDIVAVGTTIQWKRGTASGDYTIYIDDVTIIELGAVADFSAAGLDPMNAIWRNGSALFPEATLGGFSQDGTGRLIGVLATEGKPWGANGTLGRLSRESGAQAYGGVFFPGNANQQLTALGPSIGTNAFWVHVQFSVPAANPGSTRGLFNFNAASVASSGANVLSGYMTTAGTLDVALYGASGTDNRIHSIPDVVTRYGGRVVDFFLSRSTTGAFSLWINGERQAASESINGTPPQFTGSVSSSYIHWGAASASSVWTGEIYRVRLGRGVLTDQLVRQLMNGGVGTGSGSAAGTPISRGGLMASADGLVLENDLTIGHGFIYPDIAGLYSSLDAAAYVATSYLADEIHKIPSRARAMTYQDADRRFSGAAPNGSGSLNTYGDGFSVAGTNTNSAADANQPNMINCASSAAVGAWAGAYSNASYYANRSPRVAMLIRLPDLTNVCVWALLWNGATGSITADSLSGNHVAGFRFSPTRAGDTKWQAVTANGSSQTTNDTGVTPTGNVVLLEIEIIYGQAVKFYIDGRLVKTNTTNLPSGALLRWQIATESRDGTARNMKFANVDINS